MASMDDQEGDRMETYVILRRGGWRTADDLAAAAERSTSQSERMPDDIAWIRSYVLEELDGSVGTVCIYQASSPEAIRRHASAADLPVDEIVKVADTVIVRPDPAAVAA
jgi:sporulation protein YlmC with PRC-barrel domain